LEEGDGRGGGELVEGFEGVAEVVAGIFEVVEFLVEELGLETGGAAFAPRGGDHFFDEIHFHVVSGLEPVDVLVEILLKVLGWFAAETDGSCQESVAVGVLGGAGFALRSYRAKGATSVGAGCFYLLFSTQFSHPLVKLPVGVGGNWVSC
jgi:hypothetical protein